MTIDTNAIASPPAGRAHKKAPLYVVISAWAAPIMVLTGWALLAAVPVTLVTFGAWTDRRIRALRWWAAALAVTYGIPLVQFLTQDTYPSMSKMLHPAIAVAIAVPAVVIIARLWRSHR